MTIASGQLSHKVYLRNYRETQSASGHPTQTWSTYATVWAKFRTLAGGERMRAAQSIGTLTHEVTIRYRSDVHVDHRILWGTRTFEVKNVRNVDERCEELRMLVVEVMSAGPSSSGSPSASPSSSAST